MRRHSPWVIGLAMLVSLAITLPPDALAQAGQTGQRAGEVERMIPKVNIVRGSQQLTGAPNALVDWGDEIKTQRDGRARITLDDGSVLNVGSDSSLRVMQYVPGAQQSEIDLDYGQLRSKVAKITQPGGKFEVHTPVGTAGVVGTDFYLAYQDNMLRLIVYEGSVRFCNLAGACVIAVGGMFSSIRGGNEAPDPPTQATPSQLVNGGNNTEVLRPQILAVAPHLSHLALLGLVIGVTVPAVVVPIVVSKQPNRTPPSPCGELAC